ncbi:type II toxin-antitoxin system RelE/ParE family toxin [Photorhabdus kayaii]|uniref:type II toxin-antitoxin system RelE/ParE family toxin n=1 Tax=Photorhabdus kayaii TaxID=230088 RepID=UPI0021D4A055|nr:type II toxin-antitoxin system RelE/ParE family toxin [Photorhabdus kayaii]MCT8351054.1 type II toxin-antitoxin system RelE/ParE family toxin [Photorhabdus kayaii]
MAVYLTKLFNKKAKKLKITTDTLLKAASEVMNGVFEADLGGGVIKKRVPLKGTGKSGGTRTIIFFKSGTNLFFFDGWSKSEVSGKGAKEIEDDDLEGYKDVAAELLKYDDKKIKKMLELKLLVEVKDEH